MSAKRRPQKKEPSPKIGEGTAILASIEFMVRDTYSGDVQMDLVDAYRAAEGIPHDADVSDDDVVRWMVCTALGVP